MSSLAPRALLTGLAIILTAAAVQAGDVYLGITMSNISPSMARALQLDEDQGVLIDEVVSDSPAEAGGIEAGDVIVAIDGRDIAGSSGLVKAIQRFVPGDEIAVTVLREGVRRDLEVTLGERKKRSVTVWGGKSDDKQAWTWSKGEEEGTKVFRWQGADGDSKIVIGDFGLGKDRGFLGIVPATIEEGEGKKLGLNGDDGVLVGELIEEGPAEAAGLKAGDVIVAFDDEAIDDGDELHEFLSDTKAGETITVRVVRDGQKREFEVELGEAPSPVKLAEMFVPRHAQPRFYSGTIAPVDEIEDLERERQDVAEMKAELEELKQELQALRQELEEKKGKQ